MIPVVSNPKFANPPSKKIFGGKGPAQLKAIAGPLSTIENKWSTIENK